MQFDTASQSKIQESDKGNEGVSFINGGSVVQPGVAGGDGVREEGLRGVDLQGEAFGVCDSVDAAYR